MPAQMRAFTQIMAIWTLERSLHDHLNLRMVNAFPCICKTAKVN